MKLLFKISLNIDEVLFNSPKTFFGAWAGGFIGISNDNHHISRFHDALEEGDTLLMVDAYDESEETQLKQLMHTRHMEASYEGEEENFKVFL